MIAKSFRMMLAGAALFLAAGVAFADLSLDGDAWTLFYRPQQEGGAWQCVPARVPGEVNLDLVRAGLLPDPLVGTNVYAHLPLEQNEWRYVRRFPRVVPPPGGSVRLRFDGVDTRAEYYLNGVRLGESDNMFVPVSFDITDLVRDDNELVVHLKSVLGSPDLGALGRNRIGGTDGEYVRKAQHSFGWDILPRLVTAGIWRHVTVETLPAVRFEDCHFIVRTVDVKTRRAEGYVDYRIVAPRRYLHVAKLRLTLTRNGREAFRLEHVIHYHQTRDFFEVADADFWWPRDAGEPALYDLTAEFVDPSGNVLARDTRRVGLRTVTLERRDWESAADPGTFRFVVNGEPIYMHGCNWTPLDACHSRDAQHLARCCDLLVDLNCNMVRCWGGGVYESDAFFDFCDANGIFVWQDFALGNIQPSQRDDFARTMAREATTVVKRLRSHPSLALWCGNNEIDRTMRGWGAFAPDPEGERISREVLPRVLREFDPFTSYLPSSPLWSKTLMRKNAGVEERGFSARLSQDHLWGPRDRYFKGAYWTNSPATFVSETGVHGCPNLASLRRMMSPAGLYPWPDPKNPFVFNDEWNGKAVSSYPDQAPLLNARNALMTHQVKAFFGSVPTDLATFVDMSQIYQAEALRCWVGTFRCRKGRTWGMLWWNLRDGWPILSDGVVDYDFVRKRAYDVLKLLQQPQLVQLCDGAARGLMAVNDRRYPVEGPVVARDVARGRVFYNRRATLPANGVLKLMDYPVFEGQGIVEITYTFENVVRTNLCLYGEPPFDYTRIFR